MLLLMMTTFLIVMTIALALIPHLLWLLLWIFGKIFGFSIAYAPFGWSALVLVVLCWSVLAYGFFVGRFQTEVKPLTFAHAALPESFSGYKIVHISDLHLSTFDDRPKALQRMVETINQQNPDLICFTGDLVTMGALEAKPYTDILRQLRANDGVVSVLGNHDMLIYRHDWKSDAERNAAVNQLVEFQRDSLDWKVLRNENLTIKRGNDSITILGVDNSSCGNQGFRTIHGGDLMKAMNGTDGFRILLSHDPTHWRAEVAGKTDIPLTLSGHTHSAQIRLFGWTPAKWAFRDVSGRFDSNAQTLYVNVGLGCTFPVRLNCPAEITVIMLEKK